MTEFVNSKGSNTSTASGGEKSGSKGKVSKGMNSSELINSIEDAQVDELYEMDDWGKILTCHPFCITQIVIELGFQYFGREFVEDLQRVWFEVGRPWIWRSSCWAQYRANKRCSH